MSLTALFLIHTEFLAEFSPNISPYMKEKKKKKHHGGYVFLVVWSLDFQHQAMTIF